MTGNTQGWEGRGVNVHMHDVMQVTPPHTHTHTHSIKLEEGDREEGIGGEEGRQAVWMWKEAEPTTLSLLPPFTKDTHTPHLISS